MWSRISRIFQAQAPPAEDGARRRLAVAVLLLETARADFAHEAPELAAVRAELGRFLSLAPAELEDLIADAGEQARHAVSLHDFVATINAQLDTQAKHELLEMLWRVAFSDGRLDPQEEHLIRRLAELLHLPHAQFIRGKLAAAPQ